MRRLFTGLLVAIGTLSSSGCDDGPLASAENDTVVIVNTAGVAITTALTLRTGQNCPEAGRTTVLSAGVPVTWSSSNNSLAVVDNMGRVTAAPGASGIVIITATPVGGGRAGTVTIVLDPTACGSTGGGERVLSSIDFTPKGGTFPVGQSVQAVATCFDQFGVAMPCPALTWVSTDPARVGVSLTGLITCASAGSAEISVRTPSGGPSRSYAFNCVGGTTGQLIANPVSITMTNCPGFQVSWPLTVSQGGTQVSGVSWSSSNPSVVSVNQTTSVATITGVAGSANLIGQTPSGGTVTIPVQVNQCPTSGQPSANPSSITLNNCPGFQANWNVAISGGTVTAGSWQSSNPSVATVNSSTGAITITGTAGTANVTVQTSNGQVTIPVTVTACQQNPSVQVSGPTTFACIAGESRQIQLNVNASGGASTAGTWTLVSSNPTGAAQVLVSWNQPQGTNTLNVNCLAPGTVTFRWTSTQFPSVQHTTVGTITAGTVICTVNGQSGATFTFTLAMNTTQTFNVVCQNQFGATILPFGHSSHPARVQFRGTQQVTINNQIFWAGFTFTATRIAAGQATLTIQAEIDNPTPIWVATVN